jgi:hypothetical protein
MGWIVALVTIPALVMLGIMHWRRGAIRDGATRLKVCGSDWSAKDFPAPDTGIAVPSKPPAWI